MKRLFALAALALVLSNTGANAAYANRAECIDAVVASCNKKPHPVPCTNSGTSQCEEVFPQNNGSPAQHGSSLFNEICGRKPLL